MVIDKNAITKSKIAAALYIKNGKKYNLKKTDFEDIVNDVFDEFLNKLIDKKTIQINKLGKFELKLVKEREMFNNFTQEKIVVPKQYKLKFSQFNSLRAEIKAIKTSPAKAKKSKIKS